MKKITFIILYISLTTGISISHAQENQDFKWAWLINGGLNHYDGTLGNEIFELDEGSLALTTGFRYGLNSSFNLGLDLGLSTLDFDNGLESIDDNFLEGQFMIEYKLNNGYILDAGSRIKPFLTGGVGSMSLGNSFNLMIPYGAGVGFKVFKDFDLRLSSIYKHTVDEDVTNYLQTTVGLVLYLNNNSESAPVARKVIDSDGDGVLDTLDDCPYEAGSSDNKGCPIKDSDGDGIADEQDACPNASGLIAFNGCPDTDGDGIEDSKDTCPKISGLEEFNGCPDTDEDGVKDSEDACPEIYGTLEGCPDSDEDGIKDSDDKCPNVKGISVNSGCPEIDDDVKQVLAQALSGIEFESGKDIIKRSSYSILDNIVGIMNQHPEFNLTISGYTDNTGSEDLNLSLSDRRAKAARQYLIDKGISGDRMMAKGYGIANPIADNATAAGRAKNRRVEFKIVF